MNLYLFLLICLVTSLAEAALAAAGFAVNNRYGESRNWHKWLATITCMPPFLANSIFSFLFIGSRFDDGRGIVPNPQANTAFTLILLWYVPSAVVLAIWVIKEFRRPGGPRW